MCVCDILQLNLVTIIILTVHSRPETRREQVELETNPSYAVVQNKSLCPDYEDITIV